MKRLALIIICLMAGTMACGPKVSTSLSVGEIIPKGSRIAVLPFENLSGRENASEKITEYFVLALRAVPDLDITEFGQTYEQMRRNRVRSATYITAAQIDSLSAGLGAGYLVTGSVLEFGEIDNQYLGKVPQVSINARLIDCRTRKTVWSGVANARGDEGEIVFGMGAVRSREELARQVIDKAVDKIAALIKR